MRGRAGVDGADLAVVLSISVRSGGTHGASDTLLGACAGAGVRSGCACDNATAGDAMAYPRIPITRVVAATLLCACIGAWAAPLRLPASLSGYRTWKALTATPHEISARLAQLCAVPQQPSATPDPHGPHANRWVMVYANPLAQSALTDATVSRFAPGAIIAKEKRMAPGADHPEGVAFMVKHRAGEFTASDGWEFLYFPSAGKSADYSGCIDCHRSRAKKDYVFGSYGP